VLGVLLNNDVCTNVAQTCIPRHSRCGLAPEHCD
jgi:hypothetical protein